MNPFIDELEEKRPRYVGYAHGRLRDWHTAEDAVAGAKLKLLTRENENPQGYAHDLIKPQYQTRSVLVYIVVRSCCLDIIRVIRRRKGEEELPDDVFEDAPPVSSSAALIELGAAAGDVAKSKIWPDAPKQTDAVLAWLDLWIELKEEPSFEQLADRLGCSPLNAKYNLRLGLIRLREWLNDNGHSDLF